MAFSTPRTTERIMLHSEFKFKFRLTWALCYVFYSIQDKVIIIIRLFRTTLLEFGPKIGGDDGTAFVRWPFEVRRWCSNNVARLWMWAAKRQRLQIVALWDYPYFKYNQISSWVLVKRTLDLQRTSINRWECSTFSYLLVQKMVARSCWTSGRVHLRDSHLYLLGHVGIGLVIAQLSYHSLW